MCPRSTPHFRKEPFPTVLGKSEEHSALTGNRYFKRPHLASDHHADEVALMNGGVGELVADSSKDGIRLGSHGP